MAHQGSPTKHPALRLETIRAAGELRIPFTSGILVGIGETPDERVEALEALAEVHAEYGHLQEVILQNFVPHPRYYGEEPAEIADEAQAHGSAAASRARCPPWATEVTLDDMRDLVRELPAAHARRGHPDPAEPVRLVAAARGRGRHRPRRAVGQRRPHLARAPVPVACTRCASSSRRAGYALTERLCVYPQYMDPEWLEQGVLDVIKIKFWSFIPRRGSGRREERPIRRDLVPGAIERAARRRVRSAPEELTALFAETRPEAIEDMRQAADELRAELAGDTVTFVVNRNINVSNVCIVGCAFCGFGQGRRSPDAYEHSRGGVPAAGARGGRVRRHRDLHAVGHPPGLDARGLRALAARRQGRGAGHPPPRLLADGGRTSWRATCRSPEVFGRLREAGLGSTPGTAAEVLARRRAPADLAEQAAGGALGRDHRGRARRRACARTVTVMFGHIEEPWELAEHMRVVRELQERTGGFTEFVPLSFIPFHTLLGRTHGIEEISREENLQAHGGLPARARAHDPEPAGELGEDGPRRRHRGAATGA